MMNGNWASVLFCPKLKKNIDAAVIWALCCWVALKILSPGHSVASENSEYAIDALEPSISRAETVEPNIDQENFEITLFAGLNSVEDFGVNAVIGLRGAYHMTEDFFIEAAYGYTDTEESSVEVVNQIELISDSDRKLTYYAVDIGWHLLPGESFIIGSWTFTNQFYLIGGVGSTEFGGDSASTLNLGLGFRILLNDAFALRLDFRDYLYEYNLLGEEKRANNFESTLGISTFF